MEWILGILIMILGAVAVFVIYLSNAVIGRGARCSMGRC